MNHLAVPTGSSNPIGLSLMQTGNGDFPSPLRITPVKVQSLARELRHTFETLAKDSTDQFIPSPVTESMLRPMDGREKGRYLAIDIGGTNLRVGFIHLHGKNQNLTSDGLNGTTTRALSKELEKAWPISEHLKNENAESLFAWIGSCITEVVRAGCDSFNLTRDVPLRLGVTFSFPMTQMTLSEATLMGMGKGFAITNDLHLGSQLLKGYEAARNPDLPPIKIAAIANDAVATLVSFVYQSEEHATRKAVMSLICGTGCNATIPLSISKLAGNSTPLEGDPHKDVKIAVNTEWTINGTAQALRQCGFVTKWDKQLDAEGDKPGFQPLEYMTAGRYLGELGRLIILDFMTTRLGLSKYILPTRLLHRFGISTTFLSHFKAPDVDTLLQMLRDEFPIPPMSPFRWDKDMAAVLYDIAKLIEIRAASIIAAATVALLSLAGEIPALTRAGESIKVELDGQLDLSERSVQRERALREAHYPVPHQIPEISRAWNAQDDRTEGMLQEQYARRGIPAESLQEPMEEETAVESNRSPPVELMVGFTGGCIAYFQDYLVDCQALLNQIILDEFGPSAPVKVVLSPCHDGGLTGAGILCGGTQALLDV